MRSSLLLVHAFYEVLLPTLMGYNSLEVTASFLLIVFDILYSVLLDSVFFLCSVHAIERRALPEFFNGENKSKTPEV